MEALLSSPENRIQGFLAAGHVCTIMGYDLYEPISRKYHVPIVVTGFEPVDILEGVKMVVQQLEGGRSAVENQYARSVRRSGNLEAKKIINKVFEPSSRNWRGIGMIPKSGLQLRTAFAKFDALQQFHGRIRQTDAPPSPSSECQSGRILQGLMKPSDCAAFGTRCTPNHPLGAPMVSSEGACAAYYRYRPLTPVTS
jgi:hydrogenase expression/formation protein HypD